MSLYTTRSTLNTVKVSKELCLTFGRLGILGINPQNTRMDAQHLPTSTLTHAVDVVPLKAPRATMGNIGLDQRVGKSFWSQLEDLLMDTWIVCMKISRMIWRSLIFQAFTTAFNVLCFKIAENRSRRFDCIRFANL